MTNRGRRLILWERRDPTAGRRGLCNSYVGTVKRHWSRAGVADRLWAVISDDWSRACIGAAGL